MCSTEVCFEIKDMELEAVAFKDHRHRQSDPSLI
jgi:hypothetical protein